VKHIVGVADMKISTQPGDQLVTYALGSCLGIAIYDPVVHVGGLLHVMLPLSTIDPAKATQNPSMFVDTGVPQLFIESYKAGAQKQRLVVKVAGGASVHGNEAEDHFQIGKRNFVMLRKLLWKNGVLLQAHDVGGTHSRTMTLDLDTGTVTLKLPTGTVTL
jgi:chemotaxis protein CheD